MAPTRREFLHAASVGGAALILGVPACGGAPRRPTIEEAELAPSQWLKIDSSGHVTLVAHKSEMGQGVRTALPMILADELGADWRQVTVVHARPGPGFPRMRTAGSGSVSSSWLPLRRAAAAAREMLVAAAAARWEIPASDCRASDGAVVHEATGRRLRFGELVEAATALPVPSEPRLKAPRELRLVGQRVAAVDLPQIISGRAVYASDIRVPGLRYAAVARNPVHGKRALRWDEAGARAVPGVDAVVPISTGLAVVAADTWTAVRGRDSLQVEWESVSDRDASTAGLWARLERALAAGGRTARSEGDLRRVMGRAVRRLDAEYRWPFQAHAAIEPLCCLAEVRGDACELWVGTQDPNEAQAEVAKLLGIPLERSPSTSRC